MRSQRQPAPAELTGAVTTRARCCDFPENAGTASASGERCRGLLPGGGRWAEASANEGAPLAAASLPGAACPWSLGGGGRGTGHAPCTHLTLLGALRVWEPQHTARRPGLHPGPPRPTRPWAAHSSPLGVPHGWAPAPQGQSPCCSPCASRCPRACTALGGGGTGPPAHLCFVPIMASAAAPREVPVGQPPLPSSTPRASSVTRGAQPVGRRVPSFPITPVGVYP